MTFYQYPDYMYHHGIKGMKWGRRRYRNKDSKATSTKKKQKNTYG